jgi:hypothetical protein
MSHIIFFNYSNRFINKYSDNKNKNNLHKHIPLFCYLFYILHSV